MITVNIIEDEDLQGVLKRFLSSLLPHQNYDADYFSTNLQSVFRYIHLEEMNMEYYVLFKLCNDLNKIKSLHTAYVPSLMRSVLENTLNTSLGDAITSPNLGVKQWLVYEHLESNLAIESVRQEACTKVYARCLELYDECFAMAEDSSTMANNLPSLKAAFTAHVGNQVLNTQARIIQGSYQQGRQTYSGYSDWLKYTIRMANEISNRLNDADDTSAVQLNSLDKVNVLLSSLKEMYVPIAKYGIPPIDGENAYDGTPMLRHRLVVIVGNENIGKSMFAKDQAVNLLMAGAKVLYMCGENAKTKIYSEVLINYIYKKYHFFVLPSHIQDIESCPENIKKVIKLAEAELIDSGNLILRDSYSYEGFYTEMVADYEKYKCDAYIIDHSFALTGGYDGDNGKRNIDNLAKDARNFRKNYPVYLMVLSHPSSYAKEYLSKDKKVNYSATKGSQNLSTDADDVFVLRDNEVLQKEGLLAIENTKRRDASVIHDNIIMRKMFDVSHLEYDEKYQAKSASLSVEADAALHNLEEFYSADNDLYSL